MSKLSPAAQAVAKAALYVSSFDPETYPSQAEEIAAAALRAAADYDPPDNPDAAYDMGWYAGMEFIQSIAAELEAQ